MSLSSHKHTLNDTRGPILARKIAHYIRRGSDFIFGTIRRFFFKRLILRGLHILYANFILYIKRYTCPRVLSYEGT